MSIDGVSGKTSYIGTSILNLRSQLDDLQTQLATGKVSTTYAGQGADRGFALGLRAQITSINAYADTATNVNTRINVANLALQGLVGYRHAGEERVDAPRPSCSTTTARPPARSRRRRRSRMRCRCSTPSPATAICFPDAPPTRRRRCRPTTCCTASERQAGLTQLISERRQADQGAGDDGPSRRHVAAADDDRDQPRRGRFGVRPEARLGEFVADRRDRHAAGRRAAGVTVDLGAVNPNDGEKVKFNFNLPDGTTESIELTATTTTPPPQARS